MHRPRGDEGCDFLTREPPELHALACLVHGALTALHTLGAVYNYRRRNWRDVAAHVAAALYDARSARHHYRTEQIALRRRSSAPLHLVTPANVHDVVEINPVDRRSAIERRQAARL
jgi:hypothetical protein